MNLVVQFADSRWKCADVTLGISSVWWWGARTFSFTSWCWTGSCRTHRCRCGSTECFSCAYLKSSKYTWKLLYTYANAFWIKLYVNIWQTRAGKFNVIRYQVTNVSLSTHSRASTLSYLYVNKVPSQWVGVFYQVAANIRLRGLPTCRI